VVNRLLKHVDVLQGNEPGRTPMVGIGGGDFSTSQRGNRSSQAKSISRILSTKFPVVSSMSIIPARCFGVLQAVKRTRNRHWVYKTCGAARCQTMIFGAQGQISGNQYVSVFPFINNVWQAAKAIPKKGRW
jgi:hypothetical protein